MVAFFPEDAGYLRRLMSGKERGGHHLQSIRGKFFHNSRLKGHPETVTNQIWRQIESFSGYSFSKAPSASYAVESYQCLYLKSYFPLEYMVSVINNRGGFYDTRVYIDKASKEGGIIHLPYVNNGSEVTHLYRKDMYLGLDLICHLDTAQRGIIAERERKDNYAGIILILPIFQKA